MRISFLPFAILFCVLVFLPACSEDSGPTNPNDTTKTIDTTDTTNHSFDTLSPCRAASNTLIKSDGFVLDGGGYNNAVFNFNSDSISTIVLALCQTELKDNLYQSNLFNS